MRALLVAAVVGAEICPFGCSSHGLCTGGFCECQKNWAGQDCSYFLMPSDLDEATEEASCLQDCSGHGDCGAGLCNCVTGWTGQDCATPVACMDNCNSPGGTCENGQCVCAAGFFGPTCADKRCPHDCWGHGACAQGACICAQGWAGAACEMADDVSACDPPCLNGAHCVSGTCYCSDGFTGADCSKPVEPAAGGAAAPPAVAVAAGGPPPGPPRMPGLPGAPPFPTKPGAVSLAGAAAAPAAGACNPPCGPNAQCLLGTCYTAAAAAPPPAPNQDVVDLTLQTQVDQLVELKRQLAKAREVQEKLDHASTTEIVAAPSARAAQAAAPAAAPAAAAAVPLRTAPHTSATPVGASPAAQVAPALPAAPEAAIAAVPAVPATPAALALDQARASNKTAAKDAVFVQGGTGLVSVAHKAEALLSDLFEKVRAKLPGVATPTAPATTPAQPASHTTAAAAQNATTHLAALAVADGLVTEVAAHPIWDAAGGSSSAPRTDADHEDWSEAGSVPSAAQSPAKAPAQAALVVESQATQRAQAAQSADSAEALDAARRVAAAIAAAEKQASALPAAHFAPPAPRVVKKKLHVVVEARDPEDDADLSSATSMLQSQQNPWANFNQTKGSASVREICELDTWNPTDEECASYVAQYSCDDSVTYGILCPNGKAVPAAAKLNEGCMATCTNATNISYVNHTETCPDDCSGHGTCNAHFKCECDDGYVGEMCDMPRCQDDCNDRGLCIVEECICDSAYYGLACQHIRCEADCNGNGYCFQGECMCKDAWTGHDCGTQVTGGGTEKVSLHKMEPKSAPGAIDVRKETSTLRKFNDDSCPSNCNNRGNCHDGTCHCFTGYSGATCLDVCPNECSHQGDCQEGACLCFAGFLGVDCSVRGCCSGHGTCDDPGECVCDAGWSGDDCSIQLTCPDPLCSGHGTCEDGKCHCVAGFNGPTCIGTSGMCNPPCTGNGFCNAGTKKCECKTGFTGPTCGAGLDECEDHCNFKGLCMNGKCACGPGWQGNACQNPFTAPGSSAGAAGKKGAGGAGGGGGGDDAGGGGGGAGQILGLGGDLDALAAKKKQVDDALAGPTCGDGGLCSGHGTCDTTTGTCKCDPGFENGDCSAKSCAAGPNGEPCGGHGLCTDGVCECVPGWGGDSGACGAQLCTLDCGDHGHCGDAGTCICQQGWIGENCRDPMCPNDCSSHGSCTFVSSDSPGQCLCEYGWAGSDCSRQAAYVTMQTCANDCNGNGLCFDGKCVCNVGFMGADCSDKVCADETKIGPKCNIPRCPNNCDGKGLCLNGKCACWEGQTGYDCSIPLPCAEPCTEACAVDTTGEKCKFCVGQCISYQGHPTIGKHNPFEDIVT